MTPAQLSAIRARLSLAHIRTDDNYLPDACALLDEVKRLTTELHASQAEVAELYADPLPAAAWVREVQQAAFRRGAEAMREAAAQKVTSYNIVVVDPAGRAFPVLESPLQTLADELRELSMPEDK
jgi:hypothetical protein